MCVFQSSSNSADLPRCKPLVTVALSFRSFSFPNQLHIGLTCVVPTTHQVSKHGVSRPHAETIRHIRDGEKGGRGMEVGEEGDYTPIATLSPPE